MVMKAKNNYLLADDIQQYFGMGCRNVTHLFVPENYDFIAAFKCFKKV